MHMMHHSGLRALRGLCFWGISLVLTLLLATSHAEVFILEGVLDYHMNLVGSKGIEEDHCERALRKKLIVNKPNEVEDQTLTSW